MKILDHKHIDREKYEQLLLDFGCTEAAMQPWVLDAVSPGWGMLLDKEGNYLFPLPIRYKFLLPYATMPIFGQRLDILSNRKYEVFRKVLRYLKREFIRGNINFTLSGLQGKKFMIRQTFHLPLNQQYDKIWVEMSDGHQKNIKKSEGLNTIKLSPESWKIHVEMKMNLLDDRNVKLSEFDKLGYVRLVDAAVANNSPLYVAINNDQIVATSLFVRIGNRYIIESASSLDGRKTLSAYALVNHFIREHSGKDVLLDFAGSNIQSIAAFRKGFGAIRSEYTNVQWRWI